jgi:hypothetical protein
MGPDVDCPHCGAYQVRPNVQMCDVCETGVKTEAEVLHRVACELRDDAEKLSRFGEARAVLIMHADRLVA